MATSAPSASGVLRSTSLPVDRGHDGRLGQTGADGLGEVGGGRAFGELPVRSVGKPYRNDACHCSPSPAQPGDCSSPERVLKGTGPPSPLRTPLAEMSPGREFTAAGPSPSPDRARWSLTDRLGAPGSRRLHDRPPSRLSRVYSSTPSKSAPRATDCPELAAASSAASAPGVSRSASSAARTWASPASPAPLRGASPQGQSGRRRRHVRPRFPVPVRPVVMGQQGQAHSTAAPSPCRDRPRRRDCRETWTSWCRPRPTRPTWNHSRTNGSTGHRFGLGCLAFVVGEDQVASPAVDVDRLAELAQRQRGTLDMPARSTGSPSRLPRRLVGQRRLPQHEVQAGPACEDPRDSRRARPPGATCRTVRSR